MLLRFDDIPRDAAKVEDTGFLDRQNNPRVIELIGRLPAVEAAFKKTGTKAVQAAIQGQPRALAGAIVFASREPEDDVFLRRIAERWEADFFPDFARHEHYEIVWQHLNWGAGHELRFLLPLWNKAEQAPLPLPKVMIDKAALWTRVQALTFDLQDPMPRHRAGIRPSFQLADRGANKGLRPALTTFVEDAVMAGELRSRGDVIADLGKIGFELVKAEPQALTVRYVGDDAELAAKARRPVVLTGPAFSDGFGQIDDPKILLIEEAARQGAKRVRDAVQAQIEGLQPAISKAVEQALDARASDAVRATDKQMNALLEGFVKKASDAAAVQNAELEFASDQTSKAVEAARRTISGCLTDFQKVATETKDVLVKGAERDLHDTVEVVKVFTREVAASKAQLDDLTAKKDAQIRKLTFGLVGAGVVALLLLVPTLYFSIGGAGMVAEVRAAATEIADEKARYQALAAATAEELEQHRAALSHAVSLQEQVQQSLQGFAQSMSFLGDAVKIEQKADGTNAVTIYTRRIPSVRNCDRDPGCVARIDTRSN